MIRLLRLVLILLALATGKSDAIASALDQSVNSCPGCPAMAICEYCPAFPVQQYNPYVNPYIPFCPTCFAASMNTYVPPLWSNLNTYQFPNYYGPGPYNGWGISSQFFPPFPVPGGVMLAKPVVFVDGPEGTHVKINIEARSPGMLLSTVPTVPRSGWEADISKNKFQTSEGVYDYLFYDARVDENHFQDLAGECGDRDVVLNYMIQGLKSRTFPEAAIDEFKLTWSVKLPWHQNLCVYPQSEKELQKSVKLSIEPKSATLIQMEYVVVPTAYHFQANKKGRPRFASAPKIEYKFAVPARTVASQGVKIYDWGVGFMVVDRPAQK